MKYMFLHPLLRRLWINNSSSLIQQDCSTQDRHGRRAAAFSFSLPPRWGQIRCLILSLFPGNTKTQMGIRDGE
jgi:hypothetical protein